MGNQLGNYLIKYDHILTFDNVNQLSELEKEHAPTFVILQWREHGVVVYGDGPKIRRIFSHTNISVERLWSEDTDAWPIQPPNFYATTF